MFAIRQKDRDTTNAQEPVVVRPPHLTPSPKPEATPVVSKYEEVQEYARAAAAIGLAVPDLTIRRFAAVLEKLGLPVYDNETVWKYMTHLAKTEGNGTGWRWRPLRERDRFNGQFGTSERDYKADLQVSTGYYYNNDGRGELAVLYSHIIPLHAVQKIAMVEAAVQNQGLSPRFFVSDYATKAEGRPDPFLMAVIPNPNLRSKEGMFVIDVWDEPGFGIMDMVK
jgi:hypothetical protein